MQQKQREEELYRRKLDFEKQIGENQAERAGGGNAGKTNPFPLGNHPSPALISPNA